ncbi:ABC transporter permease [Pseudoalteromonas fenneropenaei]|uniref:ABC transporter permease n=1 Tax=Pseudoalteromonas fenneropenaei TaxID=1737459 RepID=A0ABV7CHQ3_9GAMM
MFEIFKKEMLELLRDRKTLFFVIALPMLVFPVLMGLAIFLTSKATFEAEQKVHNYAIVHAEFAPEFAERLFYHRSFKQVKNSNDFDSIESLKTAVQDGVIDVGIYLDIAPQSGIEQGQQAKWSVVFNDAKSISFIYSRIEDLAQEYGASLTKTALLNKGVTEDKQTALLKPIVLAKVDTADKRENLGEKLGIIIPYLLIPLVLMGASYPAIDMGAGEKERGTLETLLLTPVARSQLVLGKFLTLLTTSVMTAVITVASMSLWVAVAISFADISVIKTAFAGVGIQEFALIFMLLLPVAAILSSLVLAISIYARSFKEAQNYMAPLSMLVIFPIMASVMPNMTLNATTAMVPITNVALAIKEIIKGTIDHYFVWLIFASMLLMAGALLLACIRWFSKETVLFR